MLGHLIIGRAVLGAERIDLDKAARLNCRMHRMLSWVSGTWRAGSVAVQSWLDGSSADLPAVAAMAMPPTAASAGATPANVIDFRPGRGPAGGSGPGGALPGTPDKTAPVVRIHPLR